MLDIQTQESAIEDEVLTATTVSSEKTVPLGASLAAATALLAACGGGGDSATPGQGGTAALSTDEGDLDALALSEEELEMQLLAPDTKAAAAAPYTAAATKVEAARFLLQAQFSASTKDISALMATTYKDWLQAQFDLPKALTGVQWLNRAGYAKISSKTNYFDQSYPGDFMIWNQLMESPDGVRKRLALALSEFFVVSLSGLDFEWRSHGIAQYWDILVEGTTGNFRDLLGEITLNPAMGFYLNTKGNQKADGRGRQPDENYAREVMQLFTIGLYKLNQDGTPKLDGDGNKIPTYTESDVSNLARVFTGYELDYSKNELKAVKYDTWTRQVGNTSPVTRRMVLNPAKHTNGASTFLGMTIDAWVDGEVALRKALNKLFGHPNVGPFFGKQMIQRLVTSNPSPAYVSRVAAAFNDNGAGVRGDMKAVFMAILLDPEARGPEGLTDPNFGKLREPMLRFIQWGRTFNVKSKAGTWKLDQQGEANQLGQSPLRSPSVFNFFRPGYVPPATAMAASGRVAPEFQLVNETTVGAYLNYMQNRIRWGFYVDSPKVPEHNYTGYVRDIAASYSWELAVVGDDSALVGRLNLLMTGNQLSTKTRRFMLDALKAMPIRSWSSEDEKLNKVCAAILMVLACADYLVQK